MVPENTTSPVGRVVSPNRLRNKQLLFLGGALLTGMAVLMVMVQFSGAGTRAPKERIPDKKSSINVAGAGNIDPRDAWVATAGKQISALERDKLALEQRLNRLEATEKKGEKIPKGEATMPAAALPTELPPLLVPPDRSSGPLTAAKVEQPGTGPAPTSPRLALPVVDPKGIAGQRLPISSLDATKLGNPITSVELDSRLQGNGANTPPPMPLNAVRVPDATAGAAARNPADIRATDSKKRSVMRDEYLPAGSLMRAVLLSGLDAPTGGQVQSNPHPVLLRLSEDAILPNRFRGQVRECFVVAAGYGDLSSERAYLRTETLSCVSVSGQSVDVALKGWAIGDDGKAGVRGRVVTKQGQAMANALIAGVMSGIGSALRDVSSTTQLNPLGGTTTAPRPGEEFRAGLGSGLSRGVDRLTNYYVSLAERMFPVVEIDAGRSVEIALSSGISLTGLVSKVDESDENAQRGADRDKRLGNVGER